MDDETNEPFFDDDATVEIPVEAKLDLHPFAPRDVTSVVADYLAAAHERGFREVRVIHGKGRGVQKAAVHRLLSAHPLVSAFHDDTLAGNWGATIVHLRS